MGVGEQDTVAADIRACVEFARKEFKPTSLGLVGFCYGGGRALEEAAAGNISIRLMMLCRSFTLLLKYRRCI